MGKPYKNPVPTEPLKYKPPKGTNHSTTYSQEEIDLINSLSIEEAYKRGLI